jgi:hypothetical protein
VRIRGERVVSRIALAALGFALALAVAVPSRAQAPAPAIPTRPLTALEAMEKLADESEVLVLARVLDVDAEAQAESIQADGSFPPDMIAAMRLTSPRVRAARLHVIEWLKGTPEANPLAVFTVEGGGAGTPIPAGWAALAGEDSTGALVALARRGNAWALRGDPLAGLDTGFRAVALRDFRALGDSVLAARGRIAPDSLLARADLVAVTGPSGDVAATPGRFAVERVIAGSAPEGDVSIRLPRPRIRPGRRLMALRRVEGGIWEPVPFHRIAWMARPDSLLPPDPTPEKAEPEVRAALERLSKVGRGPKPVTP